LHITSNTLGNASTLVKRMSMGSLIRDVCGGYAARPHSREIGGGRNYMCLHEKPQWLRSIPGQGGHWTGSIFGVGHEAWAGYNSVFSLTNNGDVSLAPHPVPCAMCNVPDRSTTVMIPARTECPAGWKK